MSDDSKTIDILLSLHEKFGRFEATQNEMNKTLDKLHQGAKEDRDRFREDLMGLENEVKNLNGFRNRVVGVASAVSAAAAFVMSVVVAYVTKKL